MMTAIVVVQCVILVVLCVLVAGLLRAYASVLRRLHELDGGDSAAFPTLTLRTADGVAGPRVVPPGRGDDLATWPPAHDLSGENLAGEIIAARVIGVPHDTVLVFLSSGCSACERFWAELGSYWAPAGARLLVVTRSVDEESPGMLRELAPAGVDVVMSSGAWNDYRVPGSPYVIVANGRTGRVRGEGSGSSLGQLADLMRVAGADTAAAAGSAAGGRIRKPRSDREREADVDRTLLSAGIGPGHPSLYAPGQPEEPPSALPGRSLTLIPPQGGVAPSGTRDGW